MNDIEALNRPNRIVNARRTTRLRELIHRDGLDFFMEAHSGLSAKIVEESGFQAVWGSGLAISASLGLRDNNEASWTQVLEVAEFMADATSIPILLDGDTGYGNFNSVRRLVRKLEQRSIAGVCLEDKLFPKTNSFLRSECQALADPEEFAGKIKAARDTQTDDHFVVVARVEALIAGLGMDDAIRRAVAYSEAGADAILIHSAWETPDQILEFAKRWDNRSPIVIVPTKYYLTPSSVFRDSGISVAIWANHLMRCSLSAMKGAAERIFKEESVASIEPQLAPLKEVFRLQRDEELRDAEHRYLPPRCAPCSCTSARRGD